MLDTKASSQVTSSKIPKSPFVPSSFREELLGELKGPPLSVYLAYLSYANTEGTAWPSLRTLAAVTGYGINAVKDARRKLAAMGLLVAVAQARSDGRFGLKRFHVCTVARKQCHGTVAPSTVARCTVARKQCQEGSPSEGSPSEVRPTDAVRRPVDAKLRVLKRVFSLSDKKQNLRAHLAAKIKERDDSFARYIDHCKGKGLRHPWGKLEQQAFEAMQYQPELRSPMLTLDFVDTAVEAFEQNRDKDLAPGILCTKVIDLCERERKSGGGYYYPPDFVEHRNWLRAREASHPSEKIRA